MSEPETTHYRVAIVGSGFGGLGTAIRLIHEGLHDFVVLERAAAVGGVWRDNTYPHCACDVQSLVYAFSFAPNPDWTRTFSPQPEILRYLRSCAERFGVLPHLRLNRPVTEARWDEEAQRWVLETPQGPITADIVVAGVGALSEPLIPALPGLETFRGETFHSARWDPGLSLKGKRVAVVGTGASAVQFIPAIQPEVARLHIYQRTAPWVLPRRDRSFSPFERRLFRALPWLQRGLRKVIAALRELMVLAFIHPWVMKLGERVALRYLKRSIHDDALRARLTPSYRMGCKRVLLSDDYLPSLAQPNVEVIATGVVRVGPSSIVGADGEEREVDAIIFGTGFQVTQPPFAHHVRGREGRILSDDWSPSPKAHLGTTISGYPNLFMLLGPNTGLGHSSVVEMIEGQIEHVIHAIRYLDRTGAASVEPRTEAQATFVQEVDAQLRTTIWNTGGCQSWYLDASGRNSTLWPRSIAAFRRRVEPFDPREYQVEARHPPRTALAPSPGEVREDRR